MKIHVIRPGDTLYRLAMAYKVPLARLLEDNQLPDPNRLVVEIGRASCRERV